MIRHSTSYWLTVRMEDQDRKAFEAAAKAAEAAMEPLGILPSEDSGEPGQACFEVDPSQGTIEETSEVHDAAIRLARNHPRVLFYLLELDEEDHCRQIATLFRNGRQISAHARLVDAPTLEEMLGADGNPANAAKGKALEALAGASASLDHLCHACADSGKDKPVLDRIVRMMNDLARIRTDLEADGL